MAPALHIGTESDGAVGPQFAHHRSSGWTAAGADTRSGPACGGAALARRDRGPADSWRISASGTAALPWAAERDVPPGDNNNVQILQAPGYVTVTHEMMHDTRIIPMDGRPHLVSAHPPVHGRLAGTLGRQHAGHRRHEPPPEHELPGTGATLHLIERYTRTAQAALRYEVTIDDPHTFERPWTAVLDLEPQGRMYQYACHEGNRGLENVLSAARAEERKAGAGSGAR